MVLALAGGLAIAGIGIHAAYADDPARAFELTDADGTRECTNASSEVLDANASDPRIIVWADCGGSRFSIVAHPTTLPGTPAVQVARFADRKTGEEWSAVNASMSVSQFGAVGGIVAGEMDLTMSERLNRPATKIHVRFHVSRTADRSSP